MTDKYKDAINKIADIITTPGEEMTDGECMDAVWSVIENDLCINIRSIRDYKIILMEANNLQKGE